MKMKNFHKNNKKNEEQKLRTLNKFDHPEGEILK